MSEMFYGASPEIFARARSLRQNMTEFELKIWELLKNKYQGYKFRRQHPMGPYIADFYCHKLKLVIELDGSHHYIDKNQKKSDEERDANMKKWGIRVLRYPNHINPENIFSEIEKIISLPPPTP